MTESEYQALLLNPGVAKANGMSISSTSSEGSKMDMSENEAELQNEIGDWCRERGWLVFTGSMAARTHRTKGEPDFIIATDDGRVLFVECKTKTGKLSTDQRAIESWLKKLGHNYHVVRSLSEFMDIANQNQNENHE